MSLKRTSHGCLSRLLSDFKDVLFIFAIELCILKIPVELLYYCMGAQPLGLPGLHLVNRNCLGPPLRRSLQKQCLLFISMEITTNTKSSITPFDRVLSAVTTIAYALSSAINKSFHAVLVKSTLAEVTYCHCQHCWNAPPTASLCSLFGL